MKPRTLESYEATLRLHLLPGLGRDTPLTAITREQVRDLLLGKVNYGSSPASVRLMLAVLRAMLGAAQYEDRLLAENPTDRVSRFLPADRGPRIDRSIPRDLLDRFLETARSVQPELATLFLIGLRTGMRAGELLGLQWQDVDLAQRTVWVRRSIDRRYRRGVPKGRRAHRLPLSREASEALKNLPRVSPWVFPSSRSHRRPWSHSHVYKTTRRVLALLDLPPSGVHCLRHTFLTQLAEHGENPWAIRDLARHRSIKTTEGYIALAGIHRALVDRLDSRRRRRIS